MKQLLALIIGTPTLVGATIWGLRAYTAHKKLETLRESRRQKEDR